MIDKIPKILYIQTMQKILTETIELSKQDIKTILKEKFGNDFSVEVNLDSEENEYSAGTSPVFKGITLTRNTLKPV